MRKFIAVIMVVLILLLGGHAYIGNLSYLQAGFFIAVSAIACAVLDWLDKSH